MKVRGVRHLVFLVGGIHVSRVDLVALLGVVRLGGAFDGFAALLMFVIIILAFFLSAHARAAVHTGLVAVAGHRARGGVVDPSADTCLLPFQQFPEMDNKGEGEQREGGEAGCGGKGGMTVQYISV